MKNIFFRNLRVSVISQFLSIALGLIRATIIPFYLGVTEFGYWQIYVLYVGLIGILSLGYIDGIYLNYGNFSAADLPLNRLRSSLLIYVAVMLIITLVLYFFIDILVFDVFKKSALYYSLVNIVLIGLTSYIYIVLQVTNQIATYSKYVVIDKLFFILFLPLLFIFGYFSFQSLMVLDIVSRFLLLLFLLFNFKVYFFGAVDSFYSGVREYLTNINDGIKLMIANMAGMIILVIGRIYVESNFSIEDFSVYSFGISITNLFLIAIGSIGVVLYPTIKRIEFSRYKILFDGMNQIAGALLFSALLFFYPTYYFVSEYMIEYAKVLPFLNLLFIICALEGKMQIVLNTFYKCMRRERAMIKANIFTVIFTVILFEVSSRVFDTVYFVVCSIAVAMFYRVTSSTFYFRRELGLKMKFMNLDIFLVLSFYLLTELLPILLSFYLFGFLSLFSIFIVYRKYRTGIISFG